MSYRNESHDFSNRTSWISAILSFVVPGVGQMYNGRILRGILWLIFVTLGYILFIIPGIVLHFICVAMSYKGTNPDRISIVQGFGVAILFFTISMVIGFFIVPSENKDSIFNFMKSSYDMASGDFNGESPFESWEGTSAERPSKHDNEERAEEALKEYALAEERYKNKHGQYTNIPEELLAEKLLDSEICLANSPMPMFDYFGYYFKHVEKQGPGRVNLKTGFVICAIPIEHGTTGTRTFAVGPTGRVLSKDNGGNPILNVSEIDSSWK